MLLRRVIEHVRLRTGGRWRSISSSSLFPWQTAWRTIPF
jgi:hypothetical protein